MMVFFHIIASAASINRYHEPINTKEQDIVTAYLQIDTRC